MSIEPKVKCAETGGADEMTEDRATPAREEMGPPAPNPCSSCPYRRGVPSGIWSHEEYDKLPRYDRETYDQPLRLFQCHQHDGDGDRTRMCGGWVGCHGPDLLALRLALIDRRISMATYKAAVTYRARVPLFESGAAAAEHGRADIDNPTAAARRTIAKITRRRSDLR